MLKKKFLKSKCKVEFVLPAKTVSGAESVFLVGDFNDWSESANPMEKSPRLFKLTLDLDLNRDYQYRFLVDGSEWHTDSEADASTLNPYGGENSVVNTNPPQA